jgi:hypothetical protein
MAYFTLSANCVASVVPRSRSDGGVTSVAFSHAGGGSSFGSAGDVFLLAKIPNQARILSVFGSVQTASTSGQTLRMVLLRVESSSGTLSVMSNVLNTITAITTGTNFSAGAGLHNPAQVSLSDDAAVQYAVLGLVAVSGTATASFSFNGAVMYETRGDSI